MRLKLGASIAGVTWRMFYAAIVAEAIFNANGSELVITSGSDGEHSDRSKHYSGNALDFRTWDVSGRESRVASQLRAALGNDYDVVIESTHLHVEYDPK